MKEELEQQTNNYVNEDKRKHKKYFFLKIQSRYVEDFKISRV